jgi:hypothetical protein
LYPVFRTPTVIGTPGNDNIVGTQGNDVIATYEGDDTVDGLGGHDINSNNALKMA